MEVRKQPLVREESVLKKKVKKLNQEAYESLKKQHEMFLEKFGREPRPDEPIFFDPNNDVPTPLTSSKLKSDLTKAARKAGLDVVRVLSAFGFEVEEEGATKDF